MQANASLVEIKAAYKKGALRAHPDRGGSSAEFRALQSAYETALKRRTAPARKSKPR